jgi:hypothetical protein
VHTDKISIRIIDSEANKQLEGPVWVSRFASESNNS